MRTDYDAQLEQIRQRWESDDSEQAAADELERADAEYERRRAECNTPARVAKAKAEVNALIDLDRIAKGDPKELMKLMGINEHE